MWHQRLHGRGLALACGAVLSAASFALGDIQLSGYFQGDPVIAPLDPCPKHGADFHCKSTLTPAPAQTIPSPTDWFRNLVDSAFPSGAGWNITYTGASNQARGTFYFDFYRAYNECPGLMGAEIQVSFSPYSDSPIQDVLWVSGFHRNIEGQELDRVDNRNRLIELGKLDEAQGTMPGPFYPFQDEDEDEPGRWQSNDQYDEFYDGPGYLCPNPGKQRSYVFETYAAWWDDYYNADGSITDVGDNGHNLTIADGFRWGYTLDCIPSAGSGVIAVIGIAMLVWIRRR